jgi:hypothetical protein
MNWSSVSGVSEDEKFQKRQIPVQFFRFRVHVAHHAHAQSVLARFRQTVSRALSRNIRNPFLAHLYHAIQLGVAGLDFRAATPIRTDHAFLSARQPAASSCSRC